MNEPRKKVDASSPPRRSHRARVLNAAASPSLEPRRVLVISRRMQTTTTARAVRIAIDMRTRSSRLFFVLIHLVGVSTIVPSSSPKNKTGHRGDGGSSSSLFSFLRHLSYGWSHAGLVGVHPKAILLERLHIESSRHGLRGLLDRIERVWNDGNPNGRHLDLLDEPYWFQDTEGKCLDPNGRFSECGDATLWRVRRKPLSKREARERRYRRRHRQKLEAKEKTRQKNRWGGSSLSQQHGDTLASPVCVWPFFCEQNSKFLQQSSVQTDEIYGYEYEPYTDQGETEGFALQLMDLDAVTANSSFSWHRSHSKSGPTSGSSGRRRLFWNFNHLPQREGEDDMNAECLSTAPSRNDSRKTALQVIPCSSKAAWAWHVNRDGILVHKGKRKRKNSRRWGRVSTRSSSKATTTGAANAGPGSGTGGSFLDSDFECVHRESSSTTALLLSCVEQQTDSDVSLVDFSLVRYPSASSKKVPAPRLQMKQVDLNDDGAESTWEPWTTLERITSQTPAPKAAETHVEREEDAAGNTNAKKQHIPTSHTSSQNHAKPSHNHLDVKSTASMLHTSVWGQGGTDNKAALRTSTSHIRSTPDGVAVYDQRMADGRKEDLGAPSKDPTSLRLRLNKASKTKEKRDNKSQTPIHSDPFEPKGNEHHHHHGQDHIDSNPHRPRKIPVHPYIQKSKDFVWVDPLTSLEYPTDLCQYLGHTKAEAGRHTLMGVGQYYRTAFNIKVYGVALYVAKRDVLADPKFGQYAALSSEELRERADFYEHLMNLPHNNEGEVMSAASAANSLGGHFDRSLFIKLNMQLSTDAIRQSLEADWSLLTEEMKSLIIESSFRERIADERMERTIQAKANSRNCSCGQLARPELNADPTCCVRGTELVFTWRKNGDLELRLDGRIFEVFPRPDIAKGLFSEYLNEDPISRDAKAHFTDGFPFLLAPLAQVKGMSSAVPPPSSKKEKIPATSSHSNPVLRLMDATVHSVGVVHTQALTLSKWMQDGAVGMSSSAIASAAGVARGINEEFDNKRRELLDNAVALQKEGIELFSSLMKQSLEEEFNDGMAVSIVNEVFPSLSPFSSGFDIYNRGDVENPTMSPASVELISDTIGIKSEPTMNFTHHMFFTAVHVYLLLLFVLSLPGSSTTRRMVNRPQQAGY